MNLTRIIIKLAYLFKPLMLRVIPTKWLRTAKHRIIDSNFKEKISALRFDPFERSFYPDGVNLIGAIQAETGLGQGCRLLAHMLKYGSIPFMVYNYIQLGAFDNKDADWNKCIENECRFNINIIHLNPYELGIALLQLDKNIWNKRYNIGFWLWELEEFPDLWSPCLDKVDEVWTPSEFTSESIRRKTGKPVYTIPYAIEAKIDDKFGRKEFGLPEDQFLFLMLYDSNSITERKNPVGVIAAFKKAFSPEDKEVGIVIRASSAADEDIELFRSLLSGYRNVYILRDTVKKTCINSLIASVDVVVSLHRSEGFGLIMAEAMYLGVPTIATNWSANTEFMNSEAACMVNYKFTKIKQDIGPYKKGQRWADPDIGQAADYMRQLYEDREYYLHKKAAAQKYIRTKLNVERVSPLIQGRIKDILEASSHNPEMLNSPSSAPVSR